MSITEAETRHTIVLTPKSDSPLAPRCHHRLFPSSWSHHAMSERENLAISGQTPYVLLSRIELETCIYDVRRRRTKTEPPSHHRRTDRSHTVVSLEPLEKHMM
ncbi:hypothetical protein F2Q69_00039799 [Brassica cretica]|uniref:Uncharacterized protein n=1 Tax=Brassica cretica TaxID=69181 RepID=A0A8S9NJK6_BRACR|nr:hypothetical protein F2Q69_00039799 [Brassica cretica]